ncbi:MAG: aminoglycoside phosphotransferase family protein, partial [bacterium]
MSIKEDLATWISEFLPPGVAAESAISLTSVSGDAGFREYYRVNSAPTLIGVNAPPEHEDVPSFVSKGLVLRAAGVHVPQIHAVNFERGFMLLEDLGDELLLGHLSEDSMARLYDLAESTLLNIQCIGVEQAVFPAYSADKLQTEMALFPEWFLEKLLNIELSDADRARISSVFDLLVDSALAQPQVVVHRDYHSRNLMILGGSDLGVIDFQDAVIGPVTYDLVSLLRDCYIRWPSDTVAQRVANYRGRLEADGIIENVSPEEFQRWFDLMGLQRHLKVLGIFARLWLRDGKARYLDDLPLVLAYTLEQTARYSELAAFDL